MSDNIEEQFVEPALVTDMTYREKALRDLFVREYLTDYDSHGAAVRIGYGKSYAREYAVRFMDDPYVQQQIKTLEKETEEEPAEVMRKRVITGLIREANFRGPGCSPAARVAALSKLAAIQGMDAPTRTKTELTGPDGQPLNGGIFVVPGIMSVEEWEKQAEAQQAALVAGTTPAATLTT